MTDLAWHRRGFLSLVGLEPHDEDTPTPRPVKLAEAGIDPQTGGAVAVLTESELDGHGGISHLRTQYWRMLPNGKQQLQTLFDIEFEASDLSNLDDRITPKAVWVLGRKIYDANSDDLLQEATEHGTKQGVLQNLSRTLAAAGQINQQMREGKLPQVAQILKERGVHDAVGEHLSITGLSEQGGFNFHAGDETAQSNHESLTVPNWVAPALMGIGVNTLDSHQRLRHEGATQENDTQTGNNYVYATQINDQDTPSVHASITALSAADSGSLCIPSLAEVNWKNDNADQATLEKLALLGGSMSHDNLLLRMQALGVINRDLHMLRRREYPATMDHLYEYDLDDRVYEFDPPPPLSQGGRLSMISLGGNNIEEIAEGFGETIGGNCKVLYHEGLDEKGRRSRVGVIVDLGLHLDPKGGVTLSAAPDVIKHLKHCNDILITHRHLDHTDGLFIYMQGGYLRRKTVHVTPEVRRAIIDKARALGIRDEDLPVFHELKGEGWLHIKDKDQKTRLSVNYARNATPHTARATPFFIHGHYNGKWIGSYLNHGDARFGRHNGEDYDGPEVDADHLNKAFFRNSNQRLLEEVPELDPAIAKRGPTYFDIDTTSITKAGWGPTELEVEENLTTLSYCFQDKGILMAMISTNDNRLETAMRVATRSHRDLTEFGTNLEKSATTANILGPNDIRLEPVKGNNIQHYMDWYFETRLKKKIAIQKTELAKNEAQHASGTDRSWHLSRLRKKIERNTLRLEAFQEAQKNKASNKRYEARDQLESDLKKKVDGREAFLGSIHVGRTSDTARQIMQHDWRRLALLTGTQSTNAEVDAALVALSEGRHSTLNGNPENNQYARPADPHKNVIFISQTAIPGNDKKQNDMITKLCAQGFTVVQAIHDGVHIHNLDNKHRAILEKELKRRNIETSSGKDDKSLIISGFPIHAGGHGHAKDCEAWVDLVKADVTAAQHTDNIKAIQRLNEIGQNLQQRCMERVVPNFEGISIQANASSKEAEISSIGKQAASLIRIELIRQNRKYHGGIMIATQVINADVDSGFRPDGLRANAKEGGYTRRVAGRKTQEVARASDARHETRPQLHEVNTTAPHDYRPHQGARTPKNWRKSPYADPQAKPAIGFER